MACTGIELANCFLLRELTVAPIVTAARLFLHVILQIPRGFKDTPVNQTKPPANKTRVWLVQTQLAYGSSEVNGQPLKFEHGRDGFICTKVNAPSRLGPHKDKIKPGKITP